MLIPRFTQESVNPKYAQGGIGDAFQTFVSDALKAEYPEVHVFPGGGKDGVIDLSETIGHDRVVIECKHIGEDGLASAQDRWREVAEKLRIHLADPEGPTKGQAQYKPWYQVHPAISRFIFCISSELRNQNQLDELHKEIAAFFQDLAVTYRHLDHLAGITIQVLDWKGLAAKLEQQPHLVFRWFPKSRPQGLIPFEEEKSRGTFKAYLKDEKLPYYSLAQHYLHHPYSRELAIPNEDDLLALLLNRDLTGLIVTGVGGIGKTRLTYELAKAAQAKGWLVLRVLSRLQRPDLENLAEKIGPEAHVLLVFDYIETQRDFAEIEQAINDLNDTYALQIYYITSCRTTYYASLPPSARRHRIDLSPIADDMDQEWLRQYRHEAVRHILENSGIEVTERHFATCHDLPIFAVFIAYLHDNDRLTDLDGLLDEADFGIWVNKRIQLSFQHVPIDRDLALLMCLLPISDASMLPRGRFGGIFDILATDGWIEKSSTGDETEDETWVSVHDTLADQIVLTYLQGIPYTVANFIDELLTLAPGLDGLRSAILTLQRISDQTSMLGMDWPSIFDQKMESDTEAWRSVRDLLVRTSLLDPGQRIQLLGLHPAVWENAWKMVEVQNALGWLARWSRQQIEKGLDAGDQEVLKTWMERASPHVGVSNYILTWGLRLFPDVIRKYALEWITYRGGLFQTHYLLVAWLKSGLPAGDIQPALKKWISTFPRASQLSFVLSAWLDAGGSPGLIADSLTEWLKYHGHEIEAAYVFRSWLDANGEPALIREQLAEWLEIQGTVAEAGFVYQSWLGVVEEKEFIREPLIGWLKQHASEGKAGFLFRSWLDADGESSVVSEPLTEWLKKQGSNLEAGYVYQSWLDAGGSLGLVREALDEWFKANGKRMEANFVVKAWLDANGDIGLVRESLIELLNEQGENTGTDFIVKAWLDAGGDPALVREALIEWLRVHGNEAEASFVYKSWLDAGGDPALVREALIEWLRTHGRETGMDFVVKAWLDANGELGLVRQPLAEWLGEHGNDATADFVFKAWLDAKGELELIRDPLIGWLRENGQKAESVFVYQSWMDAKGNLDVIRDALTGWLKGHGEEVKASLIYRSWLDAKGEVDLVREPLVDWLKKHGNEARATFVFQSWLDAKGDPEVIREALTGWLKEHGNESDATFVYQDWLIAKGDPGVIRVAIAGWLKEHGNEIEATFIFQNWLDAKGDLELIRNSIAGWLKEHVHEVRASFVYKSWLDAKGELDLIQDPLIEWLGANGGKTEAGFVYQSWLNAKGKPDVVRDFITEWLKGHAYESKASFVYKSWLDAKGDPAVIRDGFLVWLNEFGDKFMAHHMFRSWLDAGGSYELIRIPVQRWLSLYSKADASKHLRKKIDERK